MAKRQPKVNQPKSLRDFAKDVFRTASGQALLQELNRVYVQKSVFDTDALVMAHAEGRRSLVIDFNYYANSQVEDDGTDDSESNIADI